MARLPVTGVVITLNEADRIQRCVSSLAAVCEDFLAGYCPQGSACKRLHTYECQTWVRTGECDVNTLAERLNLPPTRLSQHLSLLRTARMVEERRNGRQHLYRLAQPQIAGWITDGLAFVEARAPAALAGELREVRELWS